VLRVKKVAPNGVGDEMRERLGEQQSFPTEKPGNANGDNHMNQQSEQAIEMFFGFVQEGIDAHAVNEHEHVAKENCEGMANEKVFESGAPGGF
jgi:hypothetical protein